MTEKRYQIAVQIRGPKPYVGRIVGQHARYGFALEFLPTRKISSKLHAAAITEPGVYKVIPGETVICSTRIDTGYVRVAEDGSVTEISKADAETHAAAVQPGVIPPLAQN